MRLQFIVISLASLLISGSAIFIDKGDPYKTGPLKVGQFSVNTMSDGSPLHTIVFYPLPADDYLPVLFLSGMSGLVPQAAYTDVLNILASHGFIVFAVDTFYPVTESDSITGTPDVSKIFAQLDWLRGHMENRTEARVAWNYTSLACHSAGCISTLAMIKQNHTFAKASVYLEPFSEYATDPVQVKIPTLSYGTQLAEEGINKCSLPGKDWRQFYKVSPCPKIVMEAKNFGHCDILNPSFWELCHLIHFCKTTNNSRNAEYRMFVQGVVAAFLAGTAEGNLASLSYILNWNNVPIQLLDLGSDLDC